MWNGESSCRNCGHVGLHGFDGEQCWAFSTCGCNMYVPLDNLEYLEWVVDKKGILNVR
jgi:hypothetical protein